MIPIEGGAVEASFVEAFVCPVEGRGVEAIWAGKKKMKLINEQGVSW